ncbi:EF-hand domain-containing protein [Saprospira grandis]|uniref:Calcium-binding EF-hand-containing protein n=1 Tax=Saprospira grandis (strain Lewin) TaxID=984262 RepID=H6L3S5_SAPGL|nr:calcium-binding protein [Saprospira grandis]AFC22760.1 calcium-binding EF-hand-containing protein [Saprospira grandis str. Lewin]
MKNLLMLIGFGLIALNAQAQDQKEKKERLSPEERFEKVDANQDGQISQAEAKGRLKKNFATIDADQNGFISLEELKNKPKGQGKKGKRKGKGKRFEKLDADQDGQISEAEAKGPIKENFATIDSNQDGFISQEELKAAPKPAKRRERKTN